MSIIYRQADRKDVAQIFSIETACFSQPWSLESLQGDICENDLAYYIVAEEDGVIVGYCGIHIISDEGHIMNVAVSPENRSRGIGRGLIETLMVQTGLDYYTLEVRASNETAIRLYNKMGFSVFGRRPKYYGDEDALIMWKGKTRF